MMIVNPKVEDTGKYTLEIMGIQSTAFLNVDGMFGFCYFHSFVSNTKTS